MRGLDLFQQALGLEQPWRVMGSASTTPASGGSCDYVEAAEKDLSGIERVEVNKTSIWRGQDYLSVFADLDAGRAAFPTEGRDAAVCEGFAPLWPAASRPPRSRRCHEMFPSCLTGPLKRLPDAEITILTADRRPLAQRRSLAPHADLRISSGLLEGLISLIEPAQHPPVATRQPQTTSQCCNDLMRRQEGP